MKNFIEIELADIINDGGYINRNTGTSAFSAFQITGDPGGGADNAYSFYGYPDSCNGTNCVQGACGSFSGFVIGQQYPTTDPDPSRKVKVTRGGVDITDGFTGAFNVLVDNSTKKVDSWFQDVYSSCSTTRIEGVFFPGDIITVPGGTTPSDSWNPNNASTGNADASLELNIVIEQDWLVPVDTSPLLVEVNDIITVVPISTTEVGIVNKIPSRLNNTMSVITLTLNEAANSAMDLVTCVNSFIKKATQNPGLNPKVDWKATGSLTNYVTNYKMDLDAAVTP